MKVSLLLLTHVAVALANPVPEALEARTVWGQSVTDKYDDLGTTLPAQNINSDGGIIYNAFQYNTNRPNGLTGFRLPSEPNFVLYRNLNPGTVATSGTCVSLQSFYFGCASTGVGTALVFVPIACTVTVTAFNSQNKQVGQQSISFTPTGATLSDMKKATINLPNASLIKFSTSVSVPVVGGAITNTNFDNVQYVQYNTKSQCGSGF